MPLNEGRFIRADVITMSLKDIADFPTDAMPKHVAFIMDGNGRWAKKRGLPRSAGHSKGAQTFKKIIRHCEKLGIKYVTVYAFSTENWKRPQSEVSAIMKLFDDYLDDAGKDFKKENTRLKFIGDRSVLSKSLVSKMEKAEKDTENRTNLYLNIAINYGGRQEILKAVQSIADDCAKGVLKPQEISEQLLSDHMYTKGQPDPDLIIRPSGEIRTSNFLLWQSAYSEFWFDNILWPDFSEKDLERAVKDYMDRVRRYGGV